MTKLNSRLALVVALAGLLDKGYQVPLEPLRSGKGRAEIQESPDPWADMSRPTNAPKISGKLRNRPCSCGSGCKAKVCRCREKKDQPPQS